MLGVIPSEQDLNGSRLKMSWLNEYFGNFDEQALGIEFGNTLYPSIYYEVAWWSDVHRSQNVRIIKVSHVVIRFYRNCTT